MTEKNKTLAELAEMVDGELSGDPNISIHGLADLATASAGEIAFMVKETGLETLKSSKASAFIVPHSLEFKDRPLIRVKNPYLAAATIQNFFQSKPFQPAGISPKAQIGNDCQISAEVSISPFVSIGNGVIIGKRTYIHPGSVIGNDVTIGDDCTIYPNVTIYDSCTIGSRVHIHAGTVIGSDGFGFATDDKGCHVKWPHIGTVEIEDDVDIGANVTIDRGTFGTTHIGKGVRIDNLVQIGHNVKIDENSVIVAQVGIAGSATLGKNVIIGGQAGVKGHIYLGDGSVVAGKSGVNSSLQPGSTVSGFPAISHKEWLRAAILYGKLPKIHGDLKDMKKQVARLNEKLLPPEADKE
jgi:UDP-3-O-[3-hydroxymyristoyl] glucosamine N-acyltransferase